MREKDQQNAQFASLIYSNSITLYFFFYRSHPAVLLNTGLSKKMDGIWNRYNVKSAGRIYTFCVLKCSEKFKVLDLP